MSSARADRELMSSFWLERYLRESERKIGDPISVSHSSELGVSNEPRR
jgi:hypothetical protein